MIERSTVSQCIEAVARRLEAAGLHFGHGTENALDEAAWLVLYVLEKPLDGSFDEWNALVSPAENSAVDSLVAERCATRKPLAYLTGTAFFARLEFEVDESVLVPRSPIAELIVEQFRPWLKTGLKPRVLDLCTGSGCIAVATAVYMPGAEVWASDISREALQVARHNILRHGVEGRVKAIRSNLFRDLPQQVFDLVVTNPPYVPAATESALPPEFRREPGIGLFSGQDGLDAPLEILLDAPRFLGDDGVLICEVGESEQRLAELLPGVPFLWLDFDHGGSGVFVLTRQQLLEAAPEVAAATRKREYVA